MASSEDSLIGQTLGKFEIVEEIGRGGMGAVYKAYDPALKRHVAVKILPAILAHDRLFVERFVREAQSIAGIRHPNLVTIHDVAEESGYNYFVMEYVEGRSLARVISRKRRIPMKTAVSVLGHVMAGLNKVHQAGLIHRDIKPANIMLDRDGRAVLMDFGLAKSDRQQGLTTAGTVLGTPEYMSPEQAQDEDVDARSDIYALGIVLYEMLSGQPPFSGKSAIAILRQHIEKPPKPLGPENPEVTPDLEAVVMRMLAKRPEERQQSLPELAMDLVRIHKTSSLLSLIHEGKRAGVLPKDAEASGPVRPSAPVTVPPSAAPAPTTPAPASVPSGKTTPDVPGPTVPAAPLPQPAPSAAPPRGLPRSLRLAIVGAAVVAMALLLRLLISQPREKRAIMREVWTPNGIREALVDEEPEVDAKLTAGRDFGGFLVRLEDGTFTFRTHTGRVKRISFAEMKELTLK